MHEWITVVPALALALQANAQNLPPSSSCSPDWTGCYVVTWRAPQFVVTDSLWVVLRRPSLPTSQGGFRYVWPDRADNPDNLGRTQFIGPTWTAAGDSLMITEGVLTTFHMVITSDRKGLFGRILVRYDSGPPFGYEAYVTVVRNSCPRIGLPN